MDEMTLILLTVAVAVVAAVVGAFVGRSIVWFVNGRRGRRRQ